MATCWHFHARPGCLPDPRGGYRVVMKLMRGVVAIGLAKRLYTESQKPENQRRIREAVDKVRARGQQGPRR